jgi:hypothetical protein
VNCGVEWGESLDGAFKGVRRRREEDEEVGGRAVGAGEAAQGKSAKSKPCWASGRRLHSNIPLARGTDAGSRGCSCSALVFGRISPPIPPLFGDVDNSYTRGQIIRLQDMFEFGPFFKKIGSLDFGGGRDIRLNCSAPCREKFVL